MPEGAEPQVRTQIQAELDSLKQATAEVTFEHQGPELDLRIDGHLAPAKLASGTAIYLGSGDHEVSVVCTHGKPFDTQVHGVPGSTLVVTVPAVCARAEAARLTLTTPDSPPEAPSVRLTTFDVTTRDVAPPESSWLLPAALATGLVALGGAGTGFYWHQRSNEARRDFLALSGTLVAREGPVPCKSGAATPLPECDDLYEHEQDRVWNANASTVAWVSAAVLGAASASLWVWLWNDQTDNVVSVGATAGGTEIRMNFEQTF